MADEQLKGVEWPEVGRAWYWAKQEMPDATQHVKQIRPMGWWDQLLAGEEASGVAYPNGTIAFNKQQMRRAGLAPETVLAHELAHIRQQQSAGTLSNIVHRLRHALTPYGQHPDEIDAFNTERVKEQGRHRGDISLPNTSGKIDPRIAALKALKP